MARTSTSATSLTHDEEIRRWAEATDVRPSCERGTGNGDDIGTVRLDFPGYTVGRGRVPDWGYLA